LTGHVTAVKNDGKDAERAEILNNYADNGQQFVSCCFVISLLLYLLTAVQLLALSLPSGVSTVFV